MVPDRRISGKRDEALDSDRWQCNLQRSRGGVEGAGPRLALMVHNKESELKNTKHRRYLRRPAAAAQHGNANGIIRLTATHNKQKAASGGRGLAEGAEPPG